MRSWGKWKKDGRQRKWGSEGHRESVPSETMWSLSFLSFLYVLHCAFLPHFYYFPNCNSPSLVYSLSLMLLLFYIFFHPTFHFKYEVLRILTNIRTPPHHEPMDSCSNSLSSALNMTEEGLYFDIKFHNF
jgi:hypothetical protein